MDVRVCERCGEALDRRARRDARYCGGTCRVAALRARRAGVRPTEVVPAELRERRRWVRHTAKKVPLRADRRGAASSTDAATWCSYEQARDSRFGVGSGFVLNGDGIVCVDLDGCVHDGELAPWAQRIVDRAGATYVELSPSGRGVHIWGRAFMRQGRVVPVPGGGKAEVYPNGRYVTVTSQRWGDTPSELGDLTGLIGELIS